MSDGPTLFVGHEIDDYGFSPVEFRLLAHFYRRGGANGLIYSSKRDIADTLDVHEDTVEVALRELVRLSVIHEEQRTGQTTLRRINPFSTWKPHPPGKRTRVKKAPGCLEHPTPPGNVPPTPPGKKHPLRYPSKGTQIKVPHPSEAFDRFWAEYPKKIKRLDSAKVFAAMKLDERIDEIINALRWQVRSELWLKDSGKFIQNPENYLRGRRWEDRPVQAYKQTFSPPSIPVAKI